MGKGVVLSNKGTYFFRTPKNQLDPAMKTIILRLKMMNVEYTENDHIKFGAWIKSTAYNINGSIKAHINKSKNNTPRIAFASLIYPTYHHG